VIFLKDDCESVLKNLGKGYFIIDINFVPDIVSWAKENSQELGEPHSPMKLITTSGDTLAMVVQEVIKDEILDDVVKNLGIRWSVKENITDINKKLNSKKKRIVYCFLKEYARSLKKIDDDELSQDQWVLDEMAGLEFFKE
jgi:hypothetical protein